MCQIVYQLCIKLVSIKELYYDARPTKSQDLQVVVSQSRGQTVTSRTCHTKLYPFRPQVHTSIQKISGHLKTLGARTVTRSRGYAEFPQISGVTLQNLAARAAARDLCDPCIRFPLPLHGFAHREVII